MFIETHILQSFVPSNLNRDDTNNPKDCEFGGVRRARISSQCLKRAMRTAPVFAATTAVDNGTRTRWMTRILWKHLSGKKPDAEVALVAAAMAAAYVGKMDDDGKRTKVAVFLSQQELATLEGALLRDWDAIFQELRSRAEKAKSDDKAEAKGKGKAKVKGSVLDAIVKDLIKATKDHTGAPDIALFGRMLADKPELNIDAACQVAHAISTHRVSMDMDFFTTVDDLQESDEPGAAMMDFAGFNSACFYRYVRLDWQQLTENLGGDAALARRTVEALLRASEAAIPSGKQNSSAAHNRPSFLLAAAHQDQGGWSLANAFERPVRPDRDSGLVAPSVAALDAYWGRLCEIYGTQGLTKVAVLALDPGLQLPNLERHRVASLHEWVQSMLDALPKEK